MTTRAAYFPLSGGENLVAPRLTLEPGELAFSENYEETREGGYQRIDGYERYDGNPSPSDAVYYILDFDAGSAEIAVGDTVTGATSSASGYVLAVQINSGAWGSAAAGHLVLYAPNGTFVDDENLQVSAVTKAVANGTQKLSWSDTDANYNTWLQAAIEKARTDISAVPGSGAIRGVWIYQGDVYAFRDNAGATAGVMHKATSSGWVAQDLGAEIDFTSGTAEFAVGETLTGGTSGATGVIVDYVVTSGTWGSTAAGKVFLKTLSGTFQAETVTSASGSATCSGAQTVNALPAGGRYDFTNYNFYGGDQTQMMYGCNGVGKAFQWDGSGFAFITTGMTTDTPTHIAAHVRHLFLSFGGSVQHSAPGEPLSWSPILGAAEIGTGDTIVAMRNLPGGVLGIWNRNSTYLLYGTDVSTWDLKTHSLTSGAIEWTVIRSIDPYYLDDKGVTRLAATQAYGDFREGVLSSRVQPWLDTKKALVTAAMIVKNKDQYRLFFSDGYGMTMTKTGRKMSFTRMNYPDVVRCSCSGEDASGNEMLIFGSDDGWVFQLDKGTSFDGAAVPAYMTLGFNHFGSPRRKKRFRKVLLEMSAPGGTNIQYTPDFTYGGTETVGAAVNTNLISASGALWGVGTWESFVWSGPTIATAEAHIDGSGVNMELSIYTSDTYENPHTVQGVLVHYSIRGLKR